MIREDDKLDVFFPYSLLESTADTFNVLIAYIGLLRVYILSSVYISLGTRR